MIFRTLAVLLGAAAVFASAPAAAADVNQARALVDAGGMSGDELAYWTVQARRYDDWVAWRKIVEGETARAETQRREAAWRQAELARLEKEMNDFKAKQAAIDPKATMSSGPLEDYLRDYNNLQAAIDAGIDPKATMSGGPLEDFLKKEARLKAALEARAQGVGAKGDGVRAVERWVWVVIDDTGQVIENDPVDVAHARLQDLIRRLAELDVRLNRRTSAEEYAAIIRELQTIDAQLDDVLAQVGGEVWRRRSTHRDTCFPAPVPDQPNPVFNCHYWAAGLPRTLDSASQLVLENVRLDVDEDEDGFPISLSASYYARYPGEVPNGEAWSGAAGEIRYGSGGALSLVVTRTDEDGELRKTSYPIKLSTGSATATLPIEGYGELSFTFRRDPANYVPWPDYQAAARGQAPDRRSSETSKIYDPTLEQPAKTAEPEAPPSTSRGPK